jgi:uncharacterized protein
MLRRLTQLVLFILLLGMSLAGARVPIPPPPSRWVNDNVGFLSPETRLALDQKLERYERETGHQVVVWIGGTIENEPLDEWAVRTFEAWRLGRKGLDDGLALFILAQDRKIAIEVGYGLEERVPDAIASRIIQEIMVPRIRAGERDQAVTAAVDALLSAIEGRPYEPAGGGAPAPEPRAGPSIFKLILYGGVALLLLILFITNPSLALYLLYVISSGRGNGGPGGGGFSGGGGRSGGGGARGSW